MIKQAKAASRLIRIGRVTVETKGDAGEFNDGVQQQQILPTGLRAD